MADILRPLVISHAQCFDGQAAIWVAEQKFGADGADYVQLKHGQPFDPAIASSRDVYLIDFAPPEPELREVAKRSNTLTIIDHHKSAEPLYAALAREYGGTEDCANARVTVVYDTGACGSLLAWGWFFPDEAPPQFLYLVDDYDRWQFKYQDTQPFIAFLQTIPFAREAWRHVLGSAGALEAYVAAGRFVRRYIELRVVEIASNATPFELDGYTVPLVTAPRALASEVGNLLAQMNDIPFAVVAEVVPDGFAVSLRSAPPHGVDVSVIAAKFNGGGHRHAAGFQLAADLGAIEQIVVEEGDEVPLVESKRPARVMH